MYYQNIQQITNQNNDFRHVLHTTSLSQVVAMSLLPGEGIGEEVHEGHDQLFIIISGQAEAIVEGQSSILEQQDLLVVPSGAKHNIRNASQEALKVLTIYTPPTHPDGTIHKTKADALAAETNSEG